VVTDSRQQYAALKELHHWLKNRWPIKQDIPEHQQKQLTQICRKIYKQHQHHKQIHAGKNKIQSHPGFKQDQFHSGFLFLGEQSATPLHDHAESFALSLLLSGAVNISIYRRAENPPENLSQLVFKETLQLQPGDFASLPADSSLIHKLSTISQTACLLDIHYPQFNSDQRHWYLPVASFGDQQLSCQRISDGKFSTYNV